MGLLRILWRLVVMGFAFVVSAVAAIVISAGSVIGAEGMPSLNEPIFDLFGKLGLIGLASVSAFAVLGGPIVLVAALVGEAFRIRSWVYYALSGGLASASGLITLGPESFIQNSVTTMIASGLVAGLVYWLIAGRGAGFLKDTPR
ncbi:MAG: hypothetical protein H6877_04175 [Rhodobiaceae bacterium]|nr:hypothetical protein [Rhodobiaceae bacterium]MCC0061711.1 hypothetical protein [Rhodobiaceae bacterium]